MWSSWGFWTACSVTCGSGRREKTRQCQGGTGCRGHSRKTETCNTRRCPCMYIIKTTSHKHSSCNQGGIPDVVILIVVWSSWGSWASCSRTCGSGIRQQSRQCEGGKGCEGERTKTASCNIRRCSCMYKFNIIG